MCELIRNNKIKEFITFVERTNLSLKSEIKESIFETNQLLTDKNDVKLIEYASFHGSNDINKYMENKPGVKLISDMWIYAVHSCNAELIRYLEDNHVWPFLSISRLSSNVPFVNDSIRMIGFCWFLKSVGLNPINLSKDG